VRAPEMEKTENEDDNEADVPTYREMIDLNDYF
jgi:hypothetical protein